MTRYADVPDPVCSLRNCAHLTGATSPPRGEIGQRPACLAFPQGIPDDIAYGHNPHTAIDPRQVGALVYQGRAVDGRS